MKKLLALLLACVLLIPAAACASPGQQPSSSSAPAPSAPASSAAPSAPAAPSEPAKPAEPFRITMLNQTFASEVQQPGSRVWKEIEEYTNTKLDITWKPSAGYDENVNLLIATNDLPMLTIIRDNKMPTIVQAIEADMFWETGPYLKDYPELSKINPAVQAATAYKGKTYGLYRWRELVRSGYVYRKDWLNNLNMSEPTNLDELYALIKAFTENDPDKNGQKDTFGLAMAADIAVKLEFHSMVVFQGGSNEWGPDGKGGVEPSFMTQPYIDAMDFFRDLYQNGYMNKDYPSASKNNIYEYWQAGQAGMFFMSMYDVVGSSVKELFKINPSAEADIFGNVKSKDGSLRLYPTVGWNGMYMISKKAVPDEASLRGCLDFLDKISDQKMQEFIQYGYEGEHYKVNADGKVEVTNVEGYQKEFADFGQLQVNYADLKRPAIREPLRMKVDAFVKENEPYAVPNAVNPFISDTQSQIGSSLDTIIYDARDKYITGAINLDQFKAEVEKWRQQGGDQVIAEYSAQYKEAGGK